eukprot:COSAG06_NODE_27435_length_593_cov_1.002024_2_plen_90_part_01
MRKTALFFHFLYKNASFYQDRLGTNIRKTQKKCRFLAGNLNSVAGRLHAHYLFLACTPFRYPVGSGQEYHVDAVQKRPFCSVILYLKANV